MAVWASRAGWRPTASFVAPPSGRRCREVPIEDVRMKAASLLYVHHYEAFFPRENCKNVKIEALASLSVFILKIPTIHILG